MATAKPQATKLAPGYYWVRAQGKPAQTAWQPAYYLSSSNLWQLFGGGMARPEQLIAVGPRMLDPAELEAKGAQAIAQAHAKGREATAAPTGKPQAPEEAPKHKAPKKRPTLRLKKPEEEAQATH